MEIENKRFIVSIIKPEQINYWLESIIWKFSKRLSLWNGKTQKYNWRLGYGIKWKWRNDIDIDTEQWRAELIITFEAN